MIKKESIILIFVLLFSVTQTYGQWTCRSKLGSHLKPFKKDFPLLWAGEVTLGHGYMSDDRVITNAMIFATLDYSWKKHQFYLEGGTKAWRNTFMGPGAYETESNGPCRIFQKQRFGLRDAFYKYENKDNKIIAGFQQFSLGEYFLVRERALGISYKNTFDNWEVNVNGGSVLKDFSRFGTFCSVHYLYNVVRDRYYPVLGQNIGETNFTGVVATWSPKEKEESGGDEFSEFGSSSEKDKILKNISLIAYSEYGTIIENVRFHYGLNSLLEFPKKIKFRAQVLNQTILNNNALVYYVNLSKSFNFGSKGQTSFNFKYYGKYDIDNNAIAYSSFSNLFIGEVMRMDLMDLPLYQLSAKHRIPKWKLHVKLQATQQFKDNNISEYNIAIGKTFFKHAKLTTMLSKLDADNLAKEYYLVRAELRVTF